MLLIIAVLIALTAAVITLKPPTPVRAHAVRRAWLSEQWLAGQRASHPR
jgi:hypothetical protein